MGFNLDDYEPVAVRLQKWLDDCKSRGVQPRVITHLVHYGEERSVFRAEFWEGDTLISTGWAEETRGDGNVNRTSHLENCETSSVGRCAANAGWAGSSLEKRPSREEMAKVARAGGGTAPSPGSSSHATPKQMGFLRKLAAERGHTTEEDIQEAVDAALGRPVLVSQLTPAQASAIIDRWKS